MLYASFQVPSELSNLIRNWNPYQVPKHGNSTEPQNELPLVPKPAVERDVEQNFPKVFNISTREPAISAHIRLKVNGVNASALIDTGSCITLAAKNLCPALGIFNLDQPKSDSAIGMAGVHVPLAGSKKVELQVGDITLRPTFHFTEGPCVSNTISSYEVILGNDISAQLPLMTIDYGAQKVRFGSTVLPLGKFPPQPTGDAQRYVRVKQTVSIPANSEAFVVCTTQTEAPGKELILVSQCSKLANKDLIVAPALISSQRPVLLVSNPSNQPVTLYEGMRLANAKEVSKEGNVFSELANQDPNIPIACVNELIPDDPTYKVDLGKSDLSESERKQLEELLESFSDVFSRHQYDLGSCTAGKVHIYTTNDPPARIRTYRVPVKYREELQKHVNMLLKAGVMKESHTPWVHNLVVVRKKDNTLRVCLDMRRPINAVT
ncbi:hypothetical protein Y032_0082g1593 [Ancylostoma ceylanicum]|uniref:Peptidase A2 domain-containing protein n=1 Tax=Ancylostoma ceylanicum TaxID=53326 RepID=A0A016TRR9_9BILA|nr:hypothetical protein Y032_0082g1593 [Ancylostoma ceylanicum]